VEKDDGLVGRRREEGGGKEGRREGGKEGRREGGKEGRREGGKEEGGDTVGHVLSKGIEPVLSLFRRLEGSRKAQLDAYLLVLLCCFVSPLSFDPRFPSSISPLLLPFPFSPPLNIRQSTF
jgi:hypothetical protein